MGMTAALCASSMAGAGICPSIASSSVNCGLKAPWGSSEKLFLQEGLLLCSKSEKYHAGALESKLEVN